jgi:hypothetical protein
MSAHYLCNGYQGYEVLGARVGELFVAALRIIRKGTSKKRATVTSSARPGTKSDCQLYEYIRDPSSRQTGHSKSRTP